MNYCLQVCSLFFCSKLTVYEMKNNKFKDICILRTESISYDNHLFTWQQPVLSYSVVTSFTSTPPWERMPVIPSLDHVYSSPMVCCRGRLGRQTPGLQEWFALDSLSKWPCLEQMVFFVTIFMICRLEVTSSAKEYTVCVADWNGVFPILEYSGLVYMPSHCTGMACGDLLPRRRFMSFSWRHLWLMSASLSFSTLANTMFEVACRTSWRRWSVCRDKNVPKPIITQSCLTEAHLYPISNSDRVLV